MIIDTHTHYWQRNTVERPHAPDGLIWRPELLVEDLLSKATAAGVDKIVQLTASLMGFDNRYSLEMARKYPEKVLGVFGRFDPLAPNVAERLDEFMGQDRMMGVRLTLHQPPYDVWLRDDMLDDFLTAAEARSVPVEIFAPFQAYEMRKMAETYPGLQIMVDHTAIRIMPQFPNRYCHWADVLKLGEAPNVWMKVSYFPESVAGIETYPFLAAQQRFRQLYDHIGADKMIWGSNYPPSLRACSYRDTLSFICEECEFLSNEDKSAILGPNFLRYMKAARGKNWA